MGAHRPTLSVDRTPPLTKQNHSSADQHTVRQVAAVGKVARTFIDQISGKSRADRTGLADLIGWVRGGDTVRVASMDRLARSTVDLAQIVARADRQEGRGRVRQRTAHLPRRRRRPVRHDQWIRPAPAAHLAGIAIPRWNDTP